MQKLVFSRYSGKLGTATRHQGPKTGTVWSVEENPSKPEATGSAGRCEPGRGRLTAPSLCPACESHPFPGRQMWFSQLALYGAEFGLLGIGSGTFPTQAGNPAHRPRGPEKPGAFPKEKTGAAHPRVSPGSSRRLGLAHGGQPEDSSGLPRVRKSRCRVLLGSGFGLYDCVCWKLSVSSSSSGSNRYLARR